MHVLLPPCHCFKEGVCVQSSAANEAARRAAAAAGSSEAAHAPRRRAAQRASAGRRPPRTQIQQQQSASSDPTPRAMCKAPDCVAADAQQSSEEEAQLEQRIAQALDCPCVDDLKAGPCGELFVSTFTCYHRSRAEPKGCDCLDVSLAFADCLRRHPEVLDAVQGAKDASELALGAPPSPTSSSSSSSSQG